MLKSKTYNESELVLQVAKGDEKAFALIFDYYRPNIYTTCLRLTGKKEIAEELVHDVFLKVWLNRKSLPEIENVGGWIYKIAQNLTFSSLRQSRRARMHMASFEVDQNESGLISPTLPVIDEKEYALLLHNAIERLPHKQQQTYKLIKQQGLKRQEVALLLKVSPETVKWNLNQAVKSVREFCMSNLDLITFLFILDRISC